MISELAILNGGITLQEAHVVCRVQLIVVLASVTLYILSVSAILPVLEVSAVQSNSL